MEPVVGKFDVEKFDGKGDFGLWKYNMLCQLEILGSNQNQARKMQMVKVLM